MRIKGNLDFEKCRDLEEGEAAAKSIMTRADEAVQKEHHAAAVNELQSRVEDWKGHKINHFGELLHFGNYTVLKGEGAKVVEREVSVIFDSLDPFTRATIFSQFTHILLRGIPQSPPPQPGVSTFRPLHCNARKKKFGILAVVFEHPAEEHDHVPVTPKTPSRRSMFPLRRKPAPEYPQVLSQPCVEPPSLNPFRFKLEAYKRATPPEEQAFEIFQNTLQVLKIGAEPEQATPAGTGRAQTSGLSTDDVYRRMMDWSHNPIFHTEASEAYPSKALTPLKFLLLKSIRQAGHLYKPNGPFKNTTLFLVSHSQLPDPTLSPAIPAAATTVAPIPKCEPMTDLEKEIADELAIESLVREQYKVYLFERILLCCKEINPNKPKNKVLAAKQPLVDKKGKPKLQLKGRIFMQNVTDVVTLSKHSTKGNAYL